jgi:hypothetical protein
VGAGFVGMQPPALHLRLLQRLCIFETCFSR